MDDARSLLCGSAYDRSRESLDAARPLRVRLLWAFIAALVGAAAPASLEAQHLGGAREVALARATTAVIGLDAFWGNPAASSTSDRTGFGMDVAQLYGMPELRSGSVHLSAPLLSTAVTLGGSTFGFELFRQTTLSMGVARAFRPGTFRRMHVGARLQETLVQIERYGGLAYTTASAGLILPVSEGIALGASATNLIAIGRVARAEAERSIAMGISYREGARLTIAADVLKEVRSPAAGRVGIEVRPVRVLALRGGLTLDPPRYSTGVGLQLNHLVLDFAAECHHALGWSTFFSLGIHW